jgi:hypothetical protein
MDYAFMHQCPGATKAQSSDGVKAYYLKYHRCPFLSSISSDNINLVGEKTVDKFLFFGRVNNSSLGTNWLTNYVFHPPD